MPPLPPVKFDPPWHNWFGLLKTTIDKLSVTVSGLTGSVANKEELTALEERFAEIEAGQFDGRSIIVVSTITSSNSIRPYDIDYDFVRVSAKGTASNNGVGSDKLEVLKMVVDPISTDEIELYFEGAGGKQGKPFVIGSAFYTMSLLTKASAEVFDERKSPLNPASKRTCELVIEYVRETEETTT